MLPTGRFIPLLRHCLLACGAFLLCGYTLAKEAELAPRYCQVIVRVVDENGEPMPGVKVQLLGTGRDALQAFGIDSPENAPGVWRFVSDSRGRCQVRLGCFRGFDSRQVTGKEGVPGWGRFYFIAAAGHLHGVSMGIAHEPEGKLAHDSYDDEWSRNGVLRTSDHPLAVTLRMRRGLQVSGRVIDTAGRPVRDFEVNVQNDLGSESHTGYGNEIFQHSTFTGRDGRFALDDIYPNTFYLQESLREETTPVWVRTKLRGKWQSEPVDQITPRRGERVIRMILVVSPQPPYRYTGQVCAADGRPIQEATLILGISRHRQSRTYEDDHTFLRASSDRNGQFEFRTATPFVRFLHVEATGFASYADDYEEKKVKAPSRWNITLYPVTK